MISAEELKKIQELRSVLSSDLLTKDRYADDHYLVKWLRARNLDVDKAAAMLEKSMQWRKEQGADEIVSKGLEMPLEYRKIYPTGILGRDEEDCLVVLLPFGRFNHRILLGEQKMETALTYNMIWMERMIGFVKRYEKETGKKGLRIVEVVDMEHYSYRELTYGPAREFAILTQHVFDDNYPEMLKTCFVINAPKIFTLLWNMIRPFLSKATVSKIQIFGGSSAEQENWKQMLMSKLKPECVPRKWGGTREGTDEFCSQDKDVWIDGPIPLSFFTNDETCSNGLKTEKVRPRDKLVIKVPVNIKDVTVAKNSAKLLWKFSVDSLDIGFSVTFQSSSNSMKDKEVIHPDSKVNSKDGVQEGYHEINDNTAAGIYYLVFDNTYSYTRSKTVHYSVQVTQAAEKDDDVIKMKPCILQDLEEQNGLTTSCNTANNINIINPDKRK